MHEEPVEAKPIPGVPKTNNPNAKRMTPLPMNKQGSNARSASRRVVPPFAATYVTDNEVVPTGLARFAALVALNTITMLILAPPVMATLVEAGCDLASHLLMASGLARCVATPKPR